MSLPCCYDGLLSILCVLGLLGTVLGPGAYTINIMNRYNDDEEYELVNGVP